jgi:hypothetical protein
VELRRLAVTEELYGLTKDEKRRILARNARRLFNIDASRHVRASAPRGSGSPS